MKTQRKTKGGDYKDAISILFRNPRGEQGLPAASGFESRPLAIAIRLAVARVGSDLWGRPPELFVQDEGFGAFHSSRLDIARGLIRRIAAMTRTFVYITHKEELASEADVRIRVTSPGEFEIEHQ